MLTIRKTKYIFLKNYFTKLFYNTFEIVLQTISFQISRFYFNFLIKTTLKGYIYISWAYIFATNISITKSFIFSNQAGKIPT